MAAHDPLDRRQAQPAARGLGGEEGLEDAGLRGFVHARAVVAPPAAPRRRRARNGSPVGCSTSRSPAATCAPSGGHLHGARPVHDRLRGVQHQVHDHLLHLARVGRDPGQPSSGRRCSMRHLLRQRRPEQAHVLAHQRVQVEGPDLEVAAPRVGEHLAGEARRPLRRFHRLLHVHPRAGEVSGSLARASAVWPSMTASRLLKSWATPPASTPRLSIFWARRRVSSLAAAVGDVVARESMHRRPSSSTSFRGEQDLSAAPPERSATSSRRSVARPQASKRVDEGRRCAGVGPEAHLLRGATHERLTGMAHQAGEALVHVEVAALLEGADRDGRRAQAGRRARNGPPKPVAASSAARRSRSPRAGARSRPRARRCARAPATRGSRGSGAARPPGACAGRTRGRSGPGAVAAASPGALAVTRARCSSIREGGAMTKRQRVAARGQALGLHRHQGQAEALLAPARRVAGVHDADRDRRSCAPCRARRATRS